MNSISEAEMSAPTPNVHTWQLADADELLDASPFLVSKFYQHYDLFMVGPSFASRFRCSIQLTYVCAPLWVQEIYSAMATALQRARYGYFLGQDLDVIQGASSLQKLRTARVDSPSDALAIMSLGQTLAAFDFLTHCDGPWMILRYSLSSAQPWYEALSANSAYDPITITPIFWDTLYCLLRQEIPVVRFDSPTDPVVDRLAGLCATLLPIFYDLCIVSNKLKRVRRHARQISSSYITCIEERLLTWTPQLPDDFHETYSDQEILGMETQAHMYRTAGLLIAHRILEPIGSGDDAGRSLANSILQDALQYQEILGSGKSLHNAVFPVLMASLEIPQVPPRIWNSFTVLNLAPICSAKLRELIEYVWIQRRHGSFDYLLDLVNAGPDFVVLP